MECAAFDANIQLTISYGEKVSDLQQDGGSVIFALFDAKCKNLFRVIYNGNAYLGTGVSPQGIITAYPNTGGTTAAAPATSDAVASPSYRTNCEVIQNI